MPEHANNPDASGGADWGSGGASTPRTVKIDIKADSFVAEGDAHAIQELYLSRNAAFYRLLEHVGLGFIALLMLVLAALVMLYAPPANAWLAPWIALPACVLGLAIGGFTVFRISATKSGFEASGGRAPTRQTSRERGGPARGRARTRRDR